MIRNSGNVVTNQAHTGPIVDIEYTFFNNLHIFFTAGSDNQVKAWSLGPDQNSFVGQGTQPLTSTPVSMTMASPSMLLIGLANGSFAGWSLEKNLVETMPAHQAPNPAIKYLSNLGPAILSGDYSGGVQIRNSTNYQLIQPAATIKTQA